MSDPVDPEDRPEAPAERALAEVERLGQQENVDHEERLGALERLHGELEAELEERDSEPRSDR